MTTTTITTQETAGVLERAAVAETITTTMAIVTMITTMTIETRAAVVEITAVAIAVLMKKTDRIMIRAI
jgi:hypothetical protein